MNKDLELFKFVVQYNHNGTQCPGSESILTLLYSCLVYLEHKMYYVGPFLLKFVLQRTEYYGGVKGVASDLGL